MRAGKIDGTEAGDSKRIFLWLLSNFFLIFMFQVSHQVPKIFSSRRIIWPCTACQAMRWLRRQCWGSFHQSPREDHPWLTWLTCLWRTPQPVRLPLSLCVHVGQEHLFPREPRKYSGTAWRLQLTGDSLALPMISTDKFNKPKWSVLRNTERGNSSQPWIIQGSWNIFFKIVLVFDKSVFWGQIAV